MDSLALVARKGKLVQQVLELGELLHMETASWIIGQLATLQRRWLAG